MSLSALLATFTPIASLIAIPMLGGYSTSINLAVLGFAWMTIAASYSPLQLEAFAPLAIRTVLYILPSLAFLIFDNLVPSLAVEVKSQGQLGIASLQSGGKRKMWRVVGWSVANVLLTVGMQAGIEFLVTDVFRMRSLLQIKGSKWTLNHLPYPWTMIKHAVLGLLTRNTIQYYVHTHLLHSPSGGRLADLHQSWHHSVKVPYSFVANYDHPVCHLLHRFLPLYLPAIAMRMHILTYLVLIAFFSLEETFVYSGYNILPSTIMLRGMARRTDLHMISDGDGNFGQLGVLDWVHDTTIGNDVVEDLKAEMEKHHVEEKAGRALDGAGDAANGLAGKLKAKAGKGRRSK
ncbi:hypothetical protein EK21DRAFT_86938 [Setomelanomma holmii]|uniref:Fatty acid hydroxylase domain-containing protein n=1 Tax=Setomelanomma holmii TaxID=210430 RepID=A0A9P4LRB1_9PLEO|nr:hypothetical protein EK21DRAFT_86938 [Setomelanomma holmii]